MRNPRNEAQLVGHIIEDIKKMWPDAWVFKTVGSPFQMSGVPDLLVCVEGLLFGLEVKHQKPGESEDYARSRATEVQRFQIRAIQASGGVARVVISPEEALRTIALGLSRSHEKKEREE